MTIQRSIPEYKDTSHFNGLELSREFGLLDPVELLTKGSLTK